jgi:small-conductance mechanosensitive channel
MATNKLMEAAADILAGSKKSATGMPSQKAEAEVVDLGGPTNQNSKPMDDSAKIDAAKAIKGKAVAPTNKPSDASAKMEEVENYSLEELEEFMVSEDFEQLDELSKNTLRSYLKGSRAENQGSLGSAGHMSDKARSLGRTDDHKDDARYQGAKDAKKRLNAMKEDIDALFADDSTISEEFKSKVSTIFEARVADRVSQIEEETEAKYAGMLEEAVESIRADLTEKVDDYLSYVVEQWMKDNEIAIESGLRSELTEDFIAGMRNLFAEHYIDVPAEKVDLVDELAGKVEELESKLNEEIERAVDLKKSLVESRKVEMTREVCEGLTDTQVEKIKSLAESVEFSTEDEYKQKLETIRENYFPSNAKKATEAQLHEEFEEEEAKKVINDPFVAAVSQAISKTKI